MFASRILDVSEDILLKWRLIIENGGKRGHTFSHPGVLIAATAACHGLVVVTRDVSDIQAASVAAFKGYTQLCEFGGRDIWVKGNAKVMCHLMFGILALTVDQMMRLVA